MRIILLGGEFQPEAQVMVDPLLKKSAENFHVDKLFVGTDGFNEEGAMVGDLMRAEAVHNMAQSARRTMILTESKKFSQVGVVSLLTYSELDTIYTDDKISDEAKKTLEAVNVQIVLAIAAQ